MGGKYIRDPIHGEIFLPDELVPIVDHPSFQRLRRVSQLGLATIVYPSATHSRFSHSLGVYHITAQATDDLVVQAYGLVHDAGHGPFSHLIEYALRRNGVEFDHDAQLKEVLSDILQDSVVSPSEVLSCEKKPIVTGGVGSDRLDYLRRDSYFAGIAVGEIAWDRIVRNVGVSRDHLVVSPKIVPNVEHVFVARFILGDALYFHKTALIANEMFVRAVGDLLEQYKWKDIVSMDDVQLIAAFREIESEWWKMIEDRRLFHMVFRSRDRNSAQEEYDRLVGRLGEENVIFGERQNWHKPPEVFLEDGTPIEEASPLVASLKAADDKRHYYFVAVRE